MPQHDFLVRTSSILVKISTAYSNLYNAAYKIHPWRSYLHISIQSSSSTWNIHNNQPKASKNSSDSLQLIFGAHRAFLICGPGDLAKHPCLNYVTNTNWWCERVSTCSEQLNKFHEKHKRHCKVSEKVTHNANGCSWSPKRLLDQARNEKQTESFHLYAFFAFSAFSHICLLLENCLPLFLISST